MPDFQLEHDVKELVDNVARHLETRHHENHYDVLHSQYPHPHFGERGGTNQEINMFAGNDLLSGGPDNDYILADSDSASATHLFDVNQRFDESDPEFKVNFLIRENYELIQHYKRNSSQLSQDQVYGNDGDDILFGQHGDDQLFGGIGDDIAFGGSGTNTATGGGGNDDVRPGSDDRPEEALLDVLESYWFASRLPWTDDLVQDIGESPEVEPDNLPFHVLVGNFLPLARTDGEGESTIDVPADVAAKTASNTWWAAVSDGSSFTNTRLIKLPAGSGNIVRVGDINGDLFDDLIAIGNGQLTVAKSTTDGYQAETWGNWPAGVTWRDIRIGDVDGDGLADIIGRTSGNWRVARSTGSSFESSVWGNWSEAANWNDVQLGDVTGDGLDDIVGRTQSGKWWIARSTGTEFVNEVWGSWSSNVSWLDVNLADVTGDGMLDIVSRTRNGSLWVATSTGSSFDTQRWHSWTNTAAWSNVMIADIDGDGIDDIIGRQNGTWWAARSTGSSFVDQELTTWSTKVNWINVRSADVNDDGRDDILGRNAVGGTWWVALTTDTESINEIWGQWTTAITWTDVVIGNFA